jgi:hypothetical protein
MRLARTSAVLAAGAALLAIPAVAKEGVRAKLDRPIRLGAAPGTTIRVAWHLVDAQGRPFGASGIYLRVSRCGRGPFTIAARSRGRGRYTARVKVPKAGISKVMVGLKGWSGTPGNLRRADVFFQFDPVLHRDCP